VISGIADGAMVVVSSLDTVMEGMKVRTQAGDQTKRDDIQARGKADAKLETD